MGRAVLTDRDAAMAGTDLHIQMGIAHAVAYLLKCPSRRKHGKCTGKRNLSAGCQPGSDADHVGFCNTAVDVSFRKRLFKYIGFGGLRQIRIQNDHILMFRSQFCQRFSIKETPLPFTVFAIMAVGMPFTVLASSKAALICPKSCPSILIT